MYKCSVLLGPAASRKHNAGYFATLGRSKTPTAEIERSAYRTPAYSTKSLQRVRWYTCFISVVFIGLRYFLVFDKDVKC